jgi:hypothetical protein
MKWALVLRPRVQAVIHPKDTGAGIPDLGLFDENQPADQQPAHGIIEVKPVSDDLMTNGAKRAGRPLCRALRAGTGDELLPVCAGDTRPADRTVRHRRTLRHRHQRECLLGSSSPTACTPGEQTRNRPARIPDARDAPECAAGQVPRMSPGYSPATPAKRKPAWKRKAATWKRWSRFAASLKRALGVRFEDEAAEDFFLSTLVQTLFYGVFSAWVLWHETHPDADCKVRPVAGYTAAQCPGHQRIV